MGRGKMADTPTDNDPVHGLSADSPFRYGTEWHWEDPRRGEHFRRCSYCGSVNPEDLATEPEWRAEWADRKYGWPHKFYVQIPNRNPDATFAVGSRTNAKTGPYAPGGERYEAPGAGWVQRDDLTDDQRAIIRRDGMVIGDNWSDWYQFGTRDAHFGKFYSMHLADPRVPDDARLAIERRSGLRFTFTPDGRVGWAPSITEVQP